MRDITLSSRSWFLIFIIIPLIASWYETLGELRRNIPDAAIRRLLALRRDPDPLMKAAREAADDALAEILSLEDGIEDD